MKNNAIVAALSLALLGGTAFAQTSGAGQDMAAPAARASSSDKASAKEARKAEGKAIAKSTMPGDDRPATTAKAKVGGDKKAAKAKRKAEGAAAAKETKEKSGPN
jgi:hypothetical protein